MNESLLHLLNEGSVLSMNKRQSVELSTAAEQAIKVRVFEHRETFVGHERMERVHTCNQSNQSALLDQQSIYRC